MIEIILVVAGATLIGVAYHIGKKLGGTEQKRKTSVRHRLDDLENDYWKLDERLEKLEKPEKKE